jgi:hypothetical protein
MQKTSVILMVVLVGFISLSMSCIAEDHSTKTSRTLDYSSDQTIHTSLEEMKGPLNGGQRKELDISLLAIQMAL